MSRADAVRRMAQEAADANAKTPGGRQANARMGIGPTIAAPPNDPPPDVRAIIDPMVRKTASKRAMIFSAMRERWCLACGEEQPANGPWCRCEDDS